MNGIYLTPAYGADYKTEFGVMSAWNSGRDFNIHIPGERVVPCSIRNQAEIYTSAVIDFGQMGLVFFYDKRTKHCILEIK